MSDAKVVIITLYCLAIYLYVLSIDQTLSGFESINSIKQVHLMTILWSQTNKWPLAVCVTLVCVFSQWNSLQPRICHLCYQMMDTELTKLWYAFSGQYCSASVFAQRQYNLSLLLRFNDILWSPIKITRLSWAAVICSRYFYDVFATAHQTISFVHSPRTFVVSFV